MENGDHGIHANVCVYLDRYSTTPSKVYCSDDYPLPEGRSNLAQEVFHHLETGEPVHYTMDLANNLWSAAMLDAGIRSSRSLRMEEVKPLVGRLGNIRGGCYMKLANVSWGWTRSRRICRMGTL